LERSEITTAEIVIYSADANARNYRISEDLLWLERRRARRAGQIQSSVHRKGHYRESSVSLGNGDQERSAAFEINGQMVADVSGEEVERYLIDNKMVQQSNAATDVPTNAPCPTEQHEGVVKLNL